MDLGELLLVLAFIAWGSFAWEWCARKIREHEQVQRAWAMVLSLPNKVGHNQAFLGTAVLATLALYSSKRQSLCTNSHEWHAVLDDYFDLGYVFRLLCNKWTVAAAESAERWVLAAVNWIITLVCALAPLPAQVAQAVNSTAGRHVAPMLSVLGRAAVGVAIATWQGAWPASRCWRQVCWTRRRCWVRVPHLDCVRPPYVLHGVKHIDTVSLTGFSGSTAWMTAAVVVATALAASCYQVGTHTSGTMSCRCPNNLQYARAPRN